MWQTLAKILKVLFSMKPSFSWNYIQSIEKKWTSRDSIAPYSFFKLKSTHEKKIHRPQSKTIFIQRKPTSSTCATNSASLCTIESDSKTRKGFRLQFTEAHFRTDTMKTNWLGYIRVNTNCYYLFADLSQPKVDRQLAPQTQEKKFKRIAFSNL